MSFRCFCTAGKLFCRLHKCILMFSRRKPNRLRSWCFDLTQRNGVLCDFFRQIIHPCFDLSILSVTFTIKISTHMHTVTKNYCVTWNIRVYMLIAQAEQPGFKFRLFFFPAFSHKSPSGLSSACVTNECVRHMEFTDEVVVVQSY